MEALAVKHREAAEADKRHSLRNTKSTLGSRWRAQNKRKEQQQKKANGTAASVPAGTKLRIANCQNVATEIFMSAPSGRMNVLHMEAATITNTSSRLLGKNCANVEIQKSYDLLDLPDSDHGYDNPEENALHSRDESQKPYIFALGTPGQLSRFDIRSIDDEVATTVKFANVSVVPVQVFWIDYEGRPLPVCGWSLASRTQRLVGSLILGMFSRVMA